jgi:hypothetical protein
MNHIPVSPRRNSLAAMMITFTALALAPAEARAQEATDSLRVELARLAALVDSLGREVARLRAEGREPEADEALTDLRAAAAAAGGGRGDDPAPEDQAFVGRQRSLQALNPEISVNADVLAHVNPDDRDADNFVPREFEISLISALDPYSRAALFISRHGEGPEVVPFGGEGAHGPEEEGEDAHGAGFAIEEGYVEWVALPGGLGLKLGRFQQQLTSLNRWHSHALPFQSRSLPHLAFVGEEALAQTGASITWLAPLGGGAAGTYEATFEMTRSENEALWGEAASPSYLTRVNGFWQFGSTVDFELGGAWVAGHFVDEDGSFGRDLYSAEMAFNWVPPARALRRGLTVRAGLMRLAGLEEHEEDPLAPEPDEDRDGVSGFWSMADVRLSERWLVGARLDRARSPFEPDVTQWLVSPTLTWWQSEFVRIRAEYDFLSGIEGGDGSGMFILQATFAMGPHKHATY